MIGRYLEFVDPAVFGDRYDSPCTLQAIVMLIARRMEADGVDPEDRKQVARINLEVAALAGHHPPDAASSLGN